MTPMYDSRISAPSTADAVTNRYRAGRRRAPPSTDAERIDRIRQLEELKAVIAAAQARETAAFVDSQRAAQNSCPACRPSGSGRDQRGKGPGAGPTHLPPHQAARYVGWVKILTTELPAHLHRPGSRSGAGMARADRGAGNDLALPRAPRPGRPERAPTVGAARPTGRSAAEAAHDRVPARPRRRRRRSAATPRRTAGSACARRRTR